MHGTATEHSVGWAELCAVCVPAGAPDPAPVFLQLRNIPSWFKGSLAACNQAVFFPMQGHSAAVGAAHSASGR